MEEIPKMCRFCLQKDAQSVDTKIIDIFNNTSDYFYEKIFKCTGIWLTPEDPIPPLICTSCIVSIEEFNRFLEAVAKSEKFLLEIYADCNDGPNTFLERYKPARNLSKPSLELVENTSSTLLQKTEDKWNDDSEYFKGSDSDNSSSSHKVKTDKQCQKIHDLETQERNRATLFLPGEKQVDTSELGHDVKKVDESNSYVCDICSKEFDTFFNYQDHQGSHNGQLVFHCTECNEVFVTREQLVEHDHNHKVQCNTCSKQVLPKSLIAHMKKHTDQHKCDDCESRHTSKAVLEKHYKARHTDIKGYVCHICGKQNSCQSSMKRHMASHSVDRPYKCKECIFSAKSSWILKVHTKRKHIAEKCICEMCAKLFKSELSLAQHKKRIHTKKNYKCEVCGKAFSEKFNMDRHILKKHSKQRIYECKICHDEFTTVKRLKEHMHTHREGCENCPKCGKLFFYKKMLQKHIVKCSANRTAHVDSEVVCL